MEPSANRWIDPPAAFATGDAARPGAHISESYSCRMAPSMFRFELIQTLSSIRPRRELNVGPVIFEELPRSPPDPTAVMETIRPEFLLREMSWNDDSVPTPSAWPTWERLSDSVHVRSPSGAV